MNRKKATVYTARKVRTMDPGRPEVDAIAVVDGRVLSTGTVKSMQPWLSHYDVTIDRTFEDKVILPGFIEPHSHFWMSAGFLSLDFIGPLRWPGPKGMNEPLKTFDDIEKRLRRLDREQKDPTKPIVAWGYDKAKQGGNLDRDVLDQISKRRPIYVLSWAPHFYFLNSAAIELAKIPDDLRSGNVHRDKDGRLTGVFSEPAGFALACAPVVDRITGLCSAEGLRFMAGIANRAGVTTTSEMMFGVIDFDTELRDHEKATAAPSFPLRMRLVTHGATVIDKHGDRACEVVKGLRDQETEKLYFRGIKFLTDGSFPLMGSRVNFPGYLDGGNGQPNDTDLFPKMLPFWKAGIQIHCHANGDKALDDTLDALAQLQATHPRFDHRFAVEHYSMSNTMQARRLRALGGVASVNNYFSHYRSLLHRTHAYGPDRSDTVARLGTLEREGVIFALHSDYPQVVVPMHPLTAVYAAVTRLAEDGETVVAPNERIGLERAMRAVTIDAAYVLGLEDKIGSLEQGKFADFTILEQDPFEVAPRHIKDIPIWGTVVSGKPFEAGDSRR